MKLKILAALAFSSAACLAQNWEFGGFGGYGMYRSGTIFGPGATVEASVRDRFAAGGVIGEDLYDHFSGEIRYLYQDGHPFLLSNGTRVEIQGQSHTITYDALFHFAKRDRRMRPFLAAGVGAKGYIAAGPPPASEPFAKIATLTTTDEWKMVTSLGGGVKFRLSEHVLVRADFRDYLTTFPRRQILPTGNNTARGIFEQFTPMLGVSYKF